MRRRVTQAFGAIVAVVLIVAITGYVYLRRSLPVVSGTVSVDGLAAPVEITRDVSGVPHVRASTRRDALFGLGYVHAQDRLWQMEFQRRIAAGRLSEVFGIATLAQDRFLRTLGTGRAARAAWDRLPDEGRADILAYVDGVNAFVEAHHGSRLPPEFTLLRFAPEPWTGPDVLGWVKMMAWDLSANYSLELLRHDLATGLDRARAESLIPSDSPEALTILARRHATDDSHALPPASTSALFLTDAVGTNWAAALVDGLSPGHPAVSDLLLTGSRTEALGSNNWVVDGSRTASGFPLLANDPHLGTRIPSVWYLARLTSRDGFSVEGATLPGAPGVALGRNGSIAWGATNVAADVQDFYLERLEGDRVEFEGTFEPLRTITEVISIRGSDPLRLDVRLTRHGPLVSDAINANTHAAGATPARVPLPPLALRWTALDEDDATVTAFLQMNDARNWDEFTAALRHLVVPSQNFVYADREGHIGYYAPGRIPVRTKGDGRYPAEGWSGAMEWAGWVPFDELPHAFDPPGGTIVTANNRPMGEGYPHLLGSDFPEPYRAQRITDLLGSRTELTPDAFASIQADTVSLHARTLLPQLLPRVRGASEEERLVLEPLTRWDFDSNGASGNAALFQAWFFELVRTIAGDELGPELLRGYQGRYSYATRFLSNTLRSDEHQWCDNRGTPSTETCDEAVSAAFRAALTTVTSRLGGNSARWRWDEMHHAVFPHQGLDAVGLFRRILSRRVPGLGDWSTVNVGPVAADRPYEQRSIPSYRQVVDLSPADDSRFVDAVGQSGHVLSSHYDDLLPVWTAVGYLPMSLEKEGGTDDTLRLVPRR